MKNYYVNDNAQGNGDHEVHVEGCSYLALAKSTTYLGIYNHCSQAVAKAKTIYPSSDGCKYCCPECHKR